MKKNKIKKISPPTDAAKAFPYRVFFIIEPADDKKLESKSSWVEINYKLVNGTDRPGPLFEGSPGGKVRFLDKDGFVLASDFFLNEDFQRTDFYSSLAVEKKRASSIVSADAQPLREGELEILRRERAEKEEAQKKEEELFQIAVGRPSPPAEPEISQVAPVLQPESPSPSPLLPSAKSAEIVNANVRPEVPASPTSAPSSSLPPAVSISTSVVPSPQGSTQGSGSNPEKEKQGSLLRESSPAAPKASSEPVLPGAPVSPLPVDTQNQVTAPSQPVKIPSPTPDKKKDLLDLGGTTNDDVQKSLSEINKKPATEVKESPSKIPGISTEDSKIEDAG